MRDRADVLPTSAAAGHRAPAQTPSSANGAGKVLSSAQMKLRMLLVDAVGEQNYIFDPDSADVTLVSREVAAFIVAIQKGQLCTDDEAQELVEFLGLALPEHAEAPEARWGITLHLNHACNLACEYCYADGRTSDFSGTDKGAYGGAVSSVDRDVLAVGLEKFMRDAPTDKVLICFLGGEPLLSEKRFLEAIDIIDEKAAMFGRHPEFQLTTNGTRLTESLVRCFKEHSFSVVVSMDGNREMHDKQRPMAGGGKSYDKVLGGIQKLSEAGIRLGLRMTAFRGRNGVEESHVSMSKLPAEAVGFQFHMYGLDALRPLEGEEKQRLFGHYHGIAHRILDGDQDASKLVTVRDVLFSIIMKQKKEYHCAAGRWSNTMTPAGDVFPCHRFVGMSEFHLGNVLDDSFHFSSTPLFEDNAVHNRVFREDGSQNCALCYAHNACGGGCAQIAAANTGRIGELPPLFCQDTRLRVQAVVRALVERMQHLDTTTATPNPM